MISKVNEIRDALKNNLLQCALALTLTLPDICGEIEFPKERCKQRYINWLEKYLPKDKFNTNCDGAITALNKGIDPEFYTLDAEKIYNLRCAFLHSGNAKIKNKNSKSQKNIVYKFTLTKIGEMDWTYDDGMGVWSDYASYNDKDSQGTIIKTYKIDPQYLCNVISDAVEEYYNDYPDKEEFDKHTVVFFSRKDREDYDRSCY